MTDRVVSDIDERTNTNETTTNEDPPIEGVVGGRPLPRGNYYSDWYDTSAWSAIDWSEPVTEDNNEDPF
jgi:hypothetical protein